MPTDITLTLSEEDAKRLEEAYRTGKLDSLGIMSLHRKVEERGDKSWVEIERQRDNERSRQDDQLKQ